MLYFFENNLSVANALFGNKHAFGILVSQCESKITLEVFIFILQRNSSTSIWYDRFKFPSELNNERGSMKHLNVLSKSSLHESCLGLSTF